MAKRPKARVDELLVARDLAADLREARALIMAGEVIVGERRADKAGERVLEDSLVRLRRRRGRFVSRGGEKLEGAMAQLSVDPTGWVCADLGASTGGFTDCLLQRGAAKVYAVDVGYNLLDWTLRQDPRVINLERTDARAFVEGLEEPLDFIVADISFNSLGKIIAPSLERLRPEGRVLLLIKPQFELDRGQVGEGGIVSDEALHAEACQRVSRRVEALGVRVDQIVPAAIKGTKGNQEFLLYGALAAPHGHA